MNALTKPSNIAHIADIRHNRVTETTAGGGGGDMETRLAILETKVDGLDKRMDKLDKRMDNLETKMDNLTKEVHQGFSTQARWMSGVAIGIVSANIAVTIAMATYLKQPAPISQPIAPQPQIIYLQPAPTPSQ